MSDLLDDMAGPGDEPGDESGHDTPAGPPAAIVARGLGLSGDRGRVFGPVDLDVPRGALAAITGPEGSGRTCLLLSLVGRMAPDEGDLTVLGHHLPHGRRALHRVSTLAHMAGIDELDEGLTVHEVLAERAGLLAPLWRRPQATDAEGIARICGPMFGDRPVPGPDLQVWHLAALDVSLLRISLALMGRPELLVVDDVDALTDPADQAVVWSGLARVTRTSGTTIVAATTSADLLPAEAIAYDAATGTQLTHHSPTHAL